MIELDGNYLEGGGQIVRTALALSMITQQAFHVTNIRAGRSQPGLKAQHLTCIKALQKLSNAQAEGATIGSTELTFYPGPVVPANVEIDIGTAGSITLLMQSLMLPCLLARKGITLTIKGGTDVAWSMPIDYFREILIPQLGLWGQIEVKLIRRGHYPKGGGIVEIKFKPKYSMNTRKDAEKYICLDTGRLQMITGICHATRDLMPKNVANRIAEACELELKSLGAPISIRSEYTESDSTGTGITVIGVYNTNEIPCKIGADVLGEKMVVAETVGINAGKLLKEELLSEAPIDKHLADNLIPFLGVFGGEIRVSSITNHTKTNIYVTEQFLGKSFSIEENKITSKIKN